MFRVLFACSKQGAVCCYALPAGWHLTAAAFLPASLYLRKEVLHVACSLPHPSHGSENAQLSVLSGAGHQLKVLLASAVSSVCPALPSDTLFRADGWSLLSLPHANRNCQGAHWSQCSSGTSLGEPDPEKASAVHSTC